MIESEMQFEVACQSKKVYSVIQVFLVLSVFPFFWLIGKPVTSLCWRPDGKAIAVGLEDGTIALHDVEAS